MRSTSSTGTGKIPPMPSQTLKAALDAGADRIVLCDTNGGTCPTT